MRWFLPNSWSFKEQIHYLKQTNKSLTLGGCLHQFLSFFFSFELYLNQFFFIFIFFCLTAEAAEWKYSFSRWDMQKPCECAKSDYKGKL